jgi:hypothetical protein
MNPAIHIAIIISAIALTGLAAIAINYSPAPAHAQQCLSTGGKGWLAPETQGQGCFQNRHDCEQYLQSIAPGTTLTCTHVK